MSKNRLKRRKLKPRKKYYDIQMIKDFLDHLMWELRINHIENTNPGCATNPELVEQLSKYSNKYNTVGLMTAMKVTYEGAENIPDEIKALVTRSMQGEKANRSQEAVNALEILQPTLEIAFMCATKFRERFVVEEMSLLDFLKSRATEENEDTIDSEEPESWD